MEARGGPLRVLPPQRSEITGAEGKAEGNLENILRTRKLPVVGKSKDDLRGHRTG